MADRHYDVAGAALLYAIERALGDRFTDDRRDAWRELYALVAAVMRRASARAVADGASA